MDIWLIWLIVAAVLIIIEVSTLMMWALCLAVGALAAMTAALCDGNIVWQVAAFTLLSVATYVIMLPWFNRRHARHNEKMARTGMDALLGRTATVTHEIKPGELGRARIDGDNWQVRAPGATETIPRGSQVKVTAYDSIILTVEERL